jgi:hypothetical protein
MREAKPEMEPGPSGQRHTSMSTHPKASVSSRWLLPLVAAAVVAAMVAVVAGVSAAGGRNILTTPPVLHLASVSSGSPGVSALPAAHVAGQGGASGSNPSGSGWQLEGTLPDKPFSGQLYLLPAGPAPQAFVSTLAATLGMNGQPQHRKGGWYLDSGTAELSVSELAGRQWTYSNHGCIAGAAFNPQAGVACAVATSAPPLPPAPGPKDVLGGSGFGPPTAASSSVPLAAPQPVPETVARNVARPVLAAVGINPDSALVETAGSQRSLVFSPDVAGLSVLGLQTRVSVDEHAKIVDASGWLATSTPGAMYPLVSAGQAFDQLRQAPQPLMAQAMPCRIVAGTQGCAPAPDRTVIGARLGLIQAYSTNGAILLVPAWLFQIRGEPSPVAAVAVDARFLGQPGQHSLGGKATSASVPGTGSGSNSSSGSTANTGAPATKQPGTSRS